MESHLGIQKLVPLRCQEVEDAVSGALQGHASDKKYGQNQVGEKCCNVYCLCRKIVKEKKNREDREISQVLEDWVNVPA